MAATLANPIAADLLTDGDAAFVRVDSRRPAHALAPGECAGAVNQRFEQGKVMPRPGVALEPWGKRANLVPSGTLYGDTDQPMTLHILTPGCRYQYETGQNEYPGAVLVRFGAVWQALAAGRGTFLAESDELALMRGQTAYATVTLEIFRAGRTLAYGRFNDPAAFDCGVLITDEWRDDAGEDGGRGRAWRILPDNEPFPIPTNGHDFWDTCRLTQAFNALVLHRHGDERHYFAAAAFIKESAGTHKSTIKLNCAPGWANGDLVQLLGDTTVGSTLNDSRSPNLPGFAYVKQETDGELYYELYQDRSLGVKFLWDDVVKDTVTYPAAVGRFWLQRSASRPGYFGNGAPGLILQPGLTTNHHALTAFENGWQAVPANTPVSGTEAASGFLLCPNHQLQPGDKILITTGATGGTANWTLQWSDGAEPPVLTNIAAGGDPSVTIAVYAAPRDGNTLRVYGSLDAALVDSGAVGTALDLLFPSDDGETGTLAKDGCASLPMPPLRESVFAKGRLLGIFGRDTILISDPMDVLHYSIFTGTVPANLGEAGQANWLRVLGEDTLLIGKDFNVLILYNLSGEPETWRLDELTREFGGIAPLAALNVGTDVQFLSEKGWMSVVRTVQGQRLAETRPVSESIPASLAKVNWAGAALACAILANNRLLVALPGKPPPDGGPVNNLVLVHNQINQRLAVRQAAVAGELAGGIEEQSEYAAHEAWEGHWTGARLTPYSFAALRVGSRTVVTYATAEGEVCYLDETAFVDDHDTAVETELTTRGYFGGQTVLGLKGQAVWETAHPLLDVFVQTPGFKEREQLESGLTYLAAESLVDGGGTAPGDQWRADYAVTAGHLAAGTPVGTHQTISEPLRMRVRDRAPQYVIQNHHGSCRIVSLVMNAAPARHQYRTA